MVVRKPAGECWGSGLYARPQIVGFKNVAIYAVFLLVCSVKPSVWCPMWWLCPMLWVAGFYLLGWC